MFVLTEYLEDLPTDLIEAQIIELAAQVNAGTCRWLELIAEYDRRGGWAGSGCLSICDWVAWRCAVSPRAAREHVRVARALEELPALHSAFAEGELSYSKMRPLTRVATAESEGDLLELARHATAAQLERMLRTFRRVEQEQAADTAEAAYLTYSWEEDGSLCVRARLAPEDGVAFLRALEAGRDSVWAERSSSGSAEPQSVDPETSEPVAADTAGSHPDSADGSAEPRPNTPPTRPPMPITNVQAFTAAIETARTRGPTSTNGGERYLVNVHVDAEALTLDAEGRCHLGDGPAIAAETARRLSCDSQLVSILERDGEPLSVGRKTRTISPALRRALTVRDGQCRFPGCERRRFLDGHHVVHWADGGETSLANTVLLCRGHHGLVHEGGFSLGLESDGALRVTAPAGWDLPASPTPPPDTGPNDLGRSNASHGLRIGPHTCAGGAGGPMDLEACVDAVARILA